MSERIPQSTSYLLIFKAYLTSTGAEATGVTIAITISKNGATSFSNPNAGATNATEMANGWYKVTLDATDTGTLGPLTVRGTSATIQDVGIALTVVSANNAGLAALPDSTAIAKTGGAIARGTVTSGGSTTSIPTSALSIAAAAASGVVADQFKNRVVLFDGDTTTAGLRGASAAISASSASNTPTLTVGTLPATPASGDTFSVI
jgi:hypothetical protein